MESGHFNFTNDGRGISFKLSFHNAGESYPEIIWNSEEVYDFAMAVKFYEKGGSEKNAEIFRHSIKVSKSIR